MTRHPVPVFRVATSEAVTPEPADSPLLAAGYRDTDRILGSLLLAHLALFAALAPLRGTWLEAAL